MTTTHTLLGSLASIRARMQRHNSNAIAKASGLAAPTVRAIRNGLNLNPTITTLDRITAALDSMEGVEHE